VSSKHREVHPPFIMFRGERRLVEHSRINDSIVGQMVNDPSDEAHLWHCVVLSIQKLTECLNCGVAIQTNLGISA